MDKKDDLVEDLRVGAYRLYYMTIHFQELGIHQKQVASEEIKEIQEVATEIAEYLAGGLAAMPEHDRFRVKVGDPSP